MVDIPATLEQELLGEKSFDASNPESVNESRKRAGRAKRNRMDFIKNVMEHAEGRKFFLDIMEDCKVFSDPIVAGDTHSTYYMLGRQSVGKQILAEVQKFSELYVLMMNENK